MLTYNSRDLQTSSALKVSPSLGGYYAVINKDFLPTSSILINSISILKSYCADPVMSVLTMINTPPLVLLIRSSLKMPKPRHGGTISIFIVSRLSLIL